MFDQLAATLSFVTGLAPFLRRTVSPGEARAQITRRLAMRKQRFLRLLRTIFHQQSSPYLPLLQRAGCTYGDAVDTVKRSGIEGLLHQLLDAGVAVDFATLKRRQDSFANPLLGGGVEVQTGGSSGRAARAKLNLDFLASRAVYDRVMFDLLELDGVPLALWYPRLPAPTGISNSLRYCRIGQPPRRWFAMLSDRTAAPGLASRAAMVFSLITSRLAGRPLPWPRDLPFEQVDTIVDWIVAAKRAATRCAVQSYTSAALKICLRAGQRGIDLAGVSFVVGGEPLSLARYRSIVSTGAAVYSRYFATETSGIAFGCGDADGFDDLHLLASEHAVVQSEPDGPLFFSSLSRFAPLLLLNVQLGDAASLTRRDCSCPFGELGLRTHLARVRSIAAITCEGQRVPLGQLAQLAEETLPAAYGGTALDYQWCEQEDAAGCGRLLLRVHPRLGALDAAALVDAALAELARGDRGLRLAAQTWRSAETIRVVREPPVISGRGKQPVVSRRP